MRSGSTKLGFSVLALGAVAMAGCGSSSSGGFAGDAGAQSDVVSLLLLDSGLVLPDGGVQPGVDATTTGSTDATTGADVVVSGGNFIAIPLVSQEAIAYGVTATVGTQTFDLDIDTGSTTIGVAASGCTTCQVSPLYTPGSTAVDQHQTAEAEYEDGSGWNGEIYEDSISLAHGTNSVMLNFVAISKQQQFFQDNSTQGIFGLGPVENAEPDTGAYVADEAATGIANVLAFELCSASGTMWLGGYDPTAGTGAVQYTPMVPITLENAFYAINVDSMALGTTSLGSTASAFQEPVIDTGTSLFYVPSPIFSAIVSALNASSGWSSLFGSATLSNQNEDCVSGGNVTAAQLDSALPAMTFSVPSSAGGADFTLSLSPTQYMYDDGQGDFCLAPGDGGDQDGSTFGDAFMTAFLTVVDIEGGRIGFAPAANCGVTNQDHRNRMLVHPRTPRRPHRPHRVAR